MDQEEYIPANIEHLRKERKKLSRHEKQRLYSYKTFEEIRAHFIQRLKERYNIDITNDEYRDLLLKFRSHDFTLIYSLSFGRKLIWLKIKDQWVLCIYGKRPAILITCLFLKDGLPVPKILSVNGVKSPQFEILIEEVIKRAFMLEEDYLKMGPKNFFIHHPAKLYDKVLIHKWHEKGEISTTHLINEVMDSCLKMDSFKIKELRW